ncbi:putative MFS family arabinose efflux permease [Mucilaginibacter frigoritolerans]|uniref:Putative MFS family arabinose efflux permease n=1 Tax=Mucilaginibacter frigoritolerans TaxID=652788 RepID=A0A562TNH3_9SPHI|nr:MFS transporter [Mucilaginibacter frigoritolerans]TWI95062.1 putative MFS family arabinose efflux permease [Mucilaginibacter frigoritolerans]
MLTSFFQLYKNAYTGLSRNSWYLSIVMLINRSGTMVVPYMSIYCIQQLHFTVIQAGIIMAFFGAGAISGSFIGGKLTDKIGFYDLQVGALLSGGMFFIIVGYLHSFYILCGGVFVLSFCNESVRPANSTAIAHYSTPENKTRSYSLNRLAVNLGWAFGAGLGGFIAAINYHLLFWVDGTTNIFAALMLLRLMPRANILTGIKKVNKAIKSASAYRDGTYLLFILFTTLFSICFFQFFIMEPVFYKIEWHFNERLIGSLMALNGLMIVAVEMVLIHNLEGKRNGIIYIYLGVALAAVDFVMLNWLPPGLIAGIAIVIVITIAEMLSMPFMNAFWISRTSENNRGQYAALYSMSWSAAQILAPLIGGFVINYGGFRMLWWGLACLCTASATGFYFLYRYTSQKELS